MTRPFPPTRRDVVTAVGFGAAAVAGGAAGAVFTERAALAEPTQHGASGVVLSGAGIDPTGVADSAPAVQRLLDGCSDGTTVVVPSGAVLRLARGIVLRRRITLTGSGELRFTRGPTSTAEPLLTVSADGVWLDGVHLTNPEEIPTYGVLARANAFRATTCLIRGFQDGIMVAATGEFHDIVVTDNLVLDVLGSGHGPGSPSRDGESNGDGIVIWGAAAVVTGNRVSCKDGRDARIGIHVEALPGRERTPSLVADSLVAISGNTVTGRFRRGIVTEGVSHTAITGNAVADSTWWGIAVIGTAHASIVSGNTVRWTRTAADDAGSVWAPHRSGVMLFCIQEPLRDVIVSGNVIEAVPGAAIETGVRLQADPGLAPPVAQRISIVNNIVDDRTGGMSTGVDLTAPTDGARVTDNHITGFQACGIRALAADRIAVQQNDIVGPGGPSATGIALDGVAASARVSGNGIADVAVAVRARDRRGATVVASNSMERTQVGVDLTASGDAIMVDANALHEVTTPVIGRAAASR